MNPLLITICDKLDDTQQLLQAMANLASNSTRQDLTGEDVAVLLDAINEKLNQVKALVQ